MKKSALLSAILGLALSACSDEPPPKPAAKIEPKPPAAIQPAAPTPGAKAPAAAVAPAPEPNKQLAARVKQALGNEAKIHAAGIDVTAAEGKVTLWGTAASAGERDRAAQAAAKVDGVKSVENRIAVVKGS